MSVVRIALAGLLLGGLLALAGPAAPAAAHANLVGSDPPAGAVLDDPPAAVTLSFSEPVRLVPDRVVVVGPDGDPVDAGEPAADGAEVAIPLGDGADALGTYLVSYRVVSADSHPVFGSVTYSVGAASEEPALPDDLGAGGTADPVVATAVTVNKYLGYAGLVLLVGPALALALLWPHRLSRRGIGRMAWSGVGLLGLSTVAGVLLQAPYTTGATLFGASGAALGEVLSSPYGTAHAVRLGVLTAVALLLRPLLAGTAGAGQSGAGQSAAGRSGAGQSGRADLVLLAALGVVGLGTWPVAGHPIASPVPAVSIAIGTVHIAAAAVWVGGLVVLAGFLLRQANERELHAILPAWSRWAALAVSVLLLAGLTQAVIEIGVPEAVLTTTYGRLLLVKLGLFVVVVGVAGYSRRLVRTRAGPGRAGTMRIAVLAEAAVLAVVMVVASVLVQSTPGRVEVAAAEQVSASEFTATLESELYSLQVIVEPAQPGTNTVHLYAYSPEGEPLPVQEWGMTAALPASGIEPIDIPYVEFSDNHIIGQVALPSAGDWELRFTLRVSEIDQASVDVTVPVS